jgi:hypothetical protein
MDVNNIDLDTLINKSIPELININKEVSSKHEFNKEWLVNNALPVIEENDRLEAINREIIRILAVRRNIIE